MHFGLPYSEYGVAVLGLLGVGLAFLALRGGKRAQDSAHARDSHREMERLLAEIGRGIRVLATPPGIGGMGMFREKQYEVARQLGELQRRLSHLEDRAREAYEQRAQRILEQAARCGITVPPP